METPERKTLDSRERGLRDSHRAMR